MRMRRWPEFCWFSTLLFSIKVVILFFLFFLFFYFLFFMAIRILIEN